MFCLASCRFFHYSANFCCSLLSHRPRLPSKILLDFVRNMHYTKNTTTVAKAPYVFTVDEKYLSLQAFISAQKRDAHEHQGGICSKCQTTGSVKVHHEFDGKEGGSLCLGTGVPRRLFGKIEGCGVRDVIDERVIYNFRLGECR